MSAKLSVLCSILNDVFLLSKFGQVRLVASVSPESRGVVTGGHNIDNLIEARLSVQPSTDRLCLCSSQTINLFRKYPEKLSSNIDPAPLAVPSGQSTSQPLIESVCETLILIWTKLAES